MTLNVLKRGLLIGFAMMVSLPLAATAGAAASATSTPTPNALLCSPELPVVGSVCTPV
ncbi:MAG: hypothetical protein AB1679_32340 [Actinomycetota bacterium]